MMARKENSRDNIIYIYFTKTNDEKEKSKTNKIRRKIII